MIPLRLATVLCAIACVPAIVAQTENASAKKPKPNVGYTDTPKIPGSKWRVHDGTRPQPRIVTPVEGVPAAEPGRPPSDAIVLFDGKDLSKWTGRRGEARWKVENGYMECVPRSGNIQTRERFGDCQLHIEWATPKEVRGDSQGRGNSGVFLMGKYEIQVLDSYDNVTYPDGQAAALYGQAPPLVNASRKPGEWQAYDILFTAPRFEGAELVAPGYVTVLHNGVVVHDHREILGSTMHRELPKYEPHGDGPIQLQDHGNPMRFRNIWIRRLDARD